jgi:DNA-directed RNA polymerase subunit omega
MNINMVSVTVEDCLQVVPNRFELVLLASYRAKTLMGGSSPLYDNKNKEKSTVVALNEIGSRLLGVEEVKDLAESNIKSQGALKNIEENSLYAEEKSDNSSLDNDLDTSNNSKNNFVDDDSDLDEEDDEDDDDDDDSYYNDLSDDDGGDDEKDGDVEIE